jgi:hypothetical protein
MQWCSGADIVEQLGNDAGAGVHVVQRCRRSAEVVQRRRGVEEQRYSGADVQMCRGGVEVEGTRALLAELCRGADIELLQSGAEEVQVQLCSGADIDVQRRCRCQGAGAEAQRCRDAGPVVQWCKV